jgi:hypothetical protein
MGEPHSSHPTVPSSSRPKVSLPYDRPVDAPFFFFFPLIDGPSFVDGTWRLVFSSNL